MSTWSVLVGLLVTFVFMGLLHAGAAYLGFPPFGSKRDGGNPSDGSACDGGGGCD